MAELSDTFDAIDRLRETPADWDSYGGHPVEPEARERAKELLRRLIQRLGARGDHYAHPVVGPDVDGGVELIWELRPVEVHACVHASGPDVAKILVLHKGTQVIDRQEIKSADDLLLLFRRHTHL